MSELTQLASVLDSRRLARDVLDEKHGGPVVLTRPWWMPEGAADLAIAVTVGKEYVEPMALRGQNDWAGEPEQFILS